MSGHVGQNTHVTFESFETIEFDHFNYLHNRLDMEIIIFKMRSNEL